MNNKIDKKPIELNTNYNTSLEINVEKEVSDQNTKKVNFNSDFINETVGQLDITVWVDYL